MNVFERALEIIDEHGWYQGDWQGPNGERCLQQAWHEAREELDPPPHWPFWRRPTWAEMPACRARADVEAAVLRAAIEQVTGEKLWGCAAQWNDESASEQDVRLVLKVAAHKLADATEHQQPESSVLSPG